MLDAGIELRRAIAEHMDRMLDAGIWASLLLTPPPSPPFPLSPITLCGESLHNFIIARLFS